MKTGTYIYTDGTNSKKFDNTKELKGIVCNVTDTHAILVAPFESEDELEWQEALDFCKEKGCLCPTIDELTGIYLNKDKINKALKDAGLDEIREDWFWSSTEYSSASAWIVYFSNGGRWYDYKYFNLYVRPVLAF